MKKILMILSLLLFLSSCKTDEEIVIKKYYSTGTVFTGSISTTDSFVGYVEGKEMLDLSSKVGGKISNIYVKEGDYIKKGQLLANLDSTEAKVGYSTANNIVDSLYAMKQATMKMFDEQILTMQYKLKQANIGEKGLQEGLQNTIKITNTQLETAKVAVDKSKSNLEHTKSILETKKSNIYDNSKNAIVGAVILDTNIIKFVDILLGITPENRDKNDSFEDYLSAKDSKYLREAETKFDEVNKKYLDYKYFYDNEIEGKKPNTDTILKGLKDGENLTEDLKSLLNIVYDVLDNSIENYNFSLNTINEYKNTISKFGNDLESSLLTVSGEYLLGLKGSSQNLVDFDKSSALELDLLEKQLLLAEKTYNQYQATSDGQIREVSTQTDIGSSQIDELNSAIEALKNQKESKLREIDAQINEVKGQRDNAGVMINNGEVRSSIDGVIISKNFEIGQVVSGGMPIFKVGTTSNLKLEITVSQEQEKDIVLGDEVLLEIEGIEKQVNSKVTSIYPAKDLLSKKTILEISFDNPENNIKIGSYVKATFKNSSGKDSILLTNNAIVSKYMTPGVYLLKDNKAIFTKIEIIKQNEKFSEVSGLEVGDLVITQGKENIFDGEILN